jgi:hypothetical protein
MKLRFALGIIYRAKSWTMCSVADAKWSATRNSSVASCYQPSSCLVDDNFHLGSVSIAVKCDGKGSCRCRHQCDITNGTGDARLAACAHPNASRMPRGSPPGRADPGCRARVPSLADPVVHQHLLGDLGGRPAWFDNTHCELDGRGNLWLARRYHRRRRADAATRPQPRRCGAAEIAPCKAHGPHDARNGGCFRLLTPSVTISGALPCRRVCRPPAKLRRRGFRRAG